MKDDTAARVEESSSQMKDADDAGGEENMVSGECADS
jgi:hypothetical protein